MRLLLPLLLLLPLASCAASGPPAPPLAGELTFVEQGFREKATGIFGAEGTLTLTITPEGGARSIVRRELLTDLERHGDLSNSERWELYTKAEAWAAVAKTELAPAGRPYGSLTYGTRKVSWQKGDSVPPELVELVQYLKVLVYSLTEIRKR